MATINDMGAEFNNSDSRPFGEIVRNVSSGWRGWRLHDRPPARVSGVRYTLYRNGAAVSGTQRELMAKVGVCQAMISKVLLGKAPHTKGWSLTPSNDNQPQLPLAA